MRTGIAERLRKLEEQTGAKGERCMVIDATAGLTQEQVESAIAALELRPGDPPVIVIDR